MQLISPLSNKHEVQMQSGFAQKENKLFKVIPLYKTSGEKKTIDSYHLEKIYDPKISTCKKCLIFAAYVLCFILLAWKSHISFSYYLTYPTETVTTKTEEKTPYLPSIAICNNMHRFPQALKMNEMANEDNFTTYDELQKLWSKYGIHSDNIRIWRPCNEFKGDHLGPDVKIKSFNSILGECVDITLDCPMQQRMFGMDIEIFHHENIYNIPSYPQLNAPNYNLYAHEIDSIDLNKIFENIEGVWLDIQLTIFFEKKQYQFLDAPNNPCVSIEEHKTCQDNCMFKMFEEKAKCKLPSMDDANLPYCKSPADIIHVLATYSRIKFLDSGFNNCSCTRACEKVEYKVNRIDTKLRPNVPSAKIGVRLEDTFDDLVQEYYIYPLSSLISDIAGIAFVFLCMTLFWMNELLPAWKKK